MKRRWTDDKDDEKEMNEQWTWVDIRVRISLGDTWRDRPKKREDDDRKSELKRLATKPETNK